MAMAVPSRAANLDDLPPHVLASVLRGFLIIDLFSVAHVCRALHSRIASGPTCRCATKERWAETHSTEPTRAFWTFWTEHSTVSRAELQLYTRFNKVVCVDYMVRWTHIMDPVDVGEYEFGIAAKDGNVDVLERLWPMAPVEWKREAWLRACRGGHLRLVKLLVAVSAPHLRDHYVRGFRSACESGHVHVVDYFLTEQLVDVAVSGGLEEATRYGQTAVVDRLLEEERTDLSQHGHRSLAHAMLFGDGTALVRLLQDDRVDPNVMATTYVTYHLVPSEDPGRLRTLCYHPRFDRKRHLPWCLEAAANAKDHTLAKDLLNEDDQAPLDVHSSPLWQRLVLNEGIVPAATSLALFRANVDARHQ